MVPRKSRPLEDEIFLIEKRNIMLEKKYDHLTVEQGKYENWKEKGYFEAGDKEKQPFCVVIPPPNVTGKLHLGHAWNTTLQDIIIRYKRYLFRNDTFAAILKITIDIIPKI